MSAARERDDAPASPRLRYLTERTLDAGPALADALVAVFDALERWRPSAPIRFAGFPGGPIERSQEAIGAYLAAVQAAARAGRIEPARFASEPGEARLDVFAGEDQRGFGRVQTVWLTVPASGPALELDQIMRMAADVCLACGGHQGVVQDESAAMAIYGSRAHRRAAAQVPEELLQYLPVPLDAEASPPFDLLLPGEIDTRAVPACVGWVNVWSERQVDQLGRERVELAPWARVTRAGSLHILAVTQAPTDIDDPAHLQRLREIVEALDLAAAQRRSCVG